MWTLCRRLRIVKCHATRVAKLTRDLSTTRDMRPGRIPWGGHRGWFRLVERCDSRRRDDEGEHHQRSESRRFEALREAEARTSNNTGEPPGGTAHGQALGCTDTRRRLHGTTGSTDQAAPPAGARDSGHLDDFDAHVSSCCHNSHRREYFESMFETIHETACCFKHIFDSCRIPRKVNTPALTFSPYRQPSNRCSHSGVR